MVFIILSSSAQQLEFNYICLWDCPPLFSISIDSSSVFLCKQTQLLMACYLPSCLFIPFSSIIYGVLSHFSSPSRRILGLTHILSSKLIPLSFSTVLIKDSTTSDTQAKTLESLWFLLFHNSLHLITLLIPPWQWVCLPILLSPCSPLTLQANPLFPCITVTLSLILFLLFLSYNPFSMW